MDGLSSYIKEQIVAGNAVLFLGAGASLDAVAADGHHKGLTGNQLRDLLCDRFLGGRSKGKALNYVAELCMSQAGIVPVHQYVHELVGALQPQPSHALLTRFRWKGIVTTNYDFLVEKAYEQAQAPLQTLHRIISDKDDFDTCLRDSQAVPYLKLHGCLSRLNDPDVPLILSSYDYYRFEQNRKTLVKTLREWGVSHPIVFCGYGIADENVKEILYDLSDKRLQRPKYAVIDPFLEPEDIDYWKTQRFDCVKLSFAEFMAKLSELVSAEQIALASMKSGSRLSVAQHFATHTPPSLALRHYLEGELTHVHPGLTTTPVLASQFYRGDSSGFAWLESNFDVRRKVIDTLLTDILLDGGRNAIAKPYLHILNGYAGSGKSVALKRFAWEAAKDFEAVVFHLADGTLFRVDEIMELSRLVSERLFVVVDDVLVHQGEIAVLMQKARDERLPITILGGARANEWNMLAVHIEADVSTTYDLLDLSVGEAAKLIEKLEAHDCLGYMAPLNAEDRLEYLREKLKHQLLVALHEATEGRSFEDIVYDEYERISPTEAKLLYLDVCTLDRFDVGIRAGLMSRISGISFSEFNERLFSPLEHIVFSKFNYRTNDYLYRSRHHHIAQFVFDKALSSPSERASQIIRILRHLNSAYESDREALSRLVKGRILADEFSDKKLAADIFKAAMDSGLSSAVIDHQRAVFELHHPHGDLKAAMAMILRAEQSPGAIQPKTLKHTKANILKRMAAVAHSPLEKHKLRGDALHILNIATRTPKDSLPFLTKGQLLLDELKEKIDQHDPTSDLDTRVVSELTKHIERTLREGLQNYPGDQTLLTFEAELSKFLKDSPRATQALERAFAADPNNGFTTIRLARLYFSRVDTREKAVQMLRKAAASNPTNKEVHFELARMLIELDETAHMQEIGQHLKRSFSSGDTRYEARLLFGRHQFLHGDRQLSKREFAQLAKAAVRSDTLHRIRHELRDATQAPIRYSGIVAATHDSFAFINCAEWSEHLFVHFSQFKPEEEWGELRVGSRVSFSLGFNFKGPAAKNVRRAEHSAQVASSPDTAGDEIETQMCNSYSLSAQEETNSAVSDEL
ncbi:SIR2 family protein [Cupriavidus pauculus]|uniref:P-loop NTPase n=1 Tax=Cupriavidus pauculus TaxID=82633 RepID=UPI001D0CCEA5|nr:SIR2 family protein [Cupriavidus pauculus]